MYTPRFINSKYIIKSFMKYDTLPGVVVCAVLVVSTRLNLFYSPIICFTYIHKHIQFNTITYKQKGKRVEPQVLKRIYGSPLCVHYTKEYKG